MSFAWHLVATLKSRSVVAMQTNAHFNVKHIWSVYNYRFSKNYCEIVLITGRFMYMYIQF